MDKERTKAYYAALPPDELCGCEYCRNFAAHVAEAYPAVAAFLEGLGVSIEKTFESFPIDPGAERMITYLDVQYVVMGSPDGFEPTEISGVTIGFADSHPPTDLDEEHFVIEASPFELKWAPPKEKNVLGAVSRAEFRAWLEANGASEQKCWIEVKGGRPAEGGALAYLDAVEEALCFGWIDSTARIVGGRSLRRFTPRKKGSLWTELNKERVRRLERLGLMTDAGRKVLPPMGPRSFRIDPELEAALKKARAWSRFKAFPPLYQRVRAYNVSFYKKRDPEKYERSLARLIEKTKKGEMYGEWNDHGRLGGG